MSALNQSGTSPVTRRRDPAETLLAVILVVFVAVVVLLAWFYNAAQRRRIEQAAGDELSAIADLKVEQIVRWRRERLNDAAWLLETSAMSAILRGYLADPTASGLGSDLEAWFRAWSKRSDYRSVILLDASLAVQLSVPSATNRPDSERQSRFRTALQTNTVQMIDLHRDPGSGRVDMNLVVPLTERAIEGASPIGVGLLIFEIDPAAFLFPHIQTWPTPSRTAETLLVRREGDDVLYLNELRHRTNTALNMRLSLTQNAVPATRAVLGERGLMQGRDYRGEPVLAAARPIPGSLWFMISKKDLAEIHTPLRAQTWTTGVIAGVLVVAASLGVGYVWRSREGRFTRDELRERTESEQALRAREARYRSYLEVTGQIGWTTDADGQVVEDLPSWRDYTGQTCEEILEWGWTKAVHPDDLDRTTEVWKRAVAEKSQYETEYRLRRSDGVYRNFLARGVPELDEQGNVEEWVGTCIDITDRHRFAKEREKLLRELERKNDEMESLIGIASHDLRSPLINIQGFSHRLEQQCADLLDWLRRADTPPDFRARWELALDQAMGQALRYIKLSADKMDVLISGLLRVSRLGRAPLHPRRLDANQLVQSVLAVMTYQIQESGADIQIAALPDCHGDADLLNQVFANLLDNALKYRDAIRPLRVQFSGWIAEGEIIYCVADTGRGIAPEHQNKIWEMFHRLEPHGPVSGEGLGLNLVRRILDRHGGRVWAESKRDEGSRFYLALPSGPDG